MVPISNSNNCVIVLANVNALCIEYTRIYRSINYCRLVLIASNTQLQIVENLNKPIRKTFPPSSTVSNMVFYYNASCSFNQFSDSSP